MDREMVRMISKAPVPLTASPLHTSENIRPQLPHVPAALLAAAISMSMNSDKGGDEEGASSEDDEDEEEAALLAAAISMSMMCP